MIGGALLGIAAVIFILSQDGGDGDGDGTTAACGLGASGITTVAVGFSRGHNAQQIIAAAGPTLGALACKQFVDALADDPTQPVGYELETAEGSVQSETVSQEELTSPAPSPPPAESTPRILTCLRWGGGYLYRLCVDGVISPPGTSVPQSVYP